MRNYIPFLLLAFSYMHADGIPFNIKTMRCEVQHVRLKMSDLQVKDADIFQEIVLDEGQISKVRKLGQPVPTRLEIIPYTYQDCTCDSLPYGIRIDRNTLLVPITSLTTISGLQNAINEGLTFTILLDHEGKFYYQKVELPFQLILKSVKIPDDTSFSPDSAKPKIVIQLPLGFNKSSTTFTRNMETLRKRAKQCGWHISIQESPQQ